jgi:transcriptional regulator with XRE-family HTH domain
VRLGLIIKKWRLLNEIGPRELAGEIGIAPATLYRIEAGRALDALTLIKILNWLCSVKN